VVSPATGVEKVKSAPFTQKRNVSVNVRHGNSVSQCIRVDQITVGARVIQVGDTVSAVGQAGYAARFSLVEILWHEKQVGSGSRVAIVLVEEAEILKYCGANEDDGDFPLLHQPSVVRISLAAFLVLPLVESSSIGGVGFAAWCRLLMAVDVLLATLPVGQLNAPVVLPDRRTGTAQAEGCVPCVDVELHRLLAQLISEVLDNNLLLSMVSDSFYVCSLYILLLAKRVGASNSEVDHCCWKKHEGIE